jgi:FdhD protein
VTEERGAPTTMSTRVRVVRAGGAGQGARGDHVVVEEPLRVHLTHRGEQTLLGSTMRTPGHDLELAAGLAVGEGVVRSRDDVVAVRPCRDGRGPQMDDVTVVVRDDVEVDLEAFGRVSRPTSACGLCGRDEIEQIAALAPPVRREVVVDLDVLTALPDRMRERQNVFQRTGGLHAAALTTAGGELLVVREDVGRHNAVDKAVGFALLEGLVPDVLVTSGRAGFEIVQKAAMAGIPVVVTVSAPTSLSVDMARRAGITLAAFVRDGRCNLYSRDDRVRLQPGTPETPIVSA